MKKLLLAALLAVFAIPAAKAQTTTYDSVWTSVNAGDHSWATFAFGHPVDGEPGTTFLVIQCGFHRAELITNVDVFGLQSSSQFFPVTCQQDGPRYVNGVPTTTYRLGGLPLIESLVMYGYYGYSGPVAHINLAINEATWTVSGYTGHGTPPHVTGEAQIVY